MSMFEVKWTSEIDAYLTTLDSAVERGVLETAEWITTDARERVHVETGSLQETIDVEPILAGGDGKGMIEYSINAGDLSGGYKGGGKLNEATGKKEGDPVDYALAQEYGPGEHSPYMTPAAEQGWVLYQQNLASMIAEVSQ